jgi:pimeloyl-ACP methyl ester carboxylesterase
VPKIKVNNLSLHYWQSGKGRDVVLVHGLGGNLAGWHLGVVPELQLQYRVLTYDLRGHGRSDAAPGCTTADMVQDLVGLLDALQIENAVFVGHSWGADIVLHLAVLHPDRVSEVVVIEGALLAPLAPTYRSPEWEGWPYVSATLESLLGRPIPEEHRCDLDYLVRTLIEIPIIYGPAQGRPRDEDLVFRVLDVLRPMWEGRESDGNMSIESLSQIQQPALLLYESNSAYAEAEQELAKRLPASDSVSLPTGDFRHFSTLEHPAQIVASILDFLKRRPAAAEVSRA